MTRLDLSGLRDLWYRIDDIFARLSEAIGSITFSGTTLSWYLANGAFSNSIDLDTVFAKDTEALGSAGSDGLIIYFYNVNGTQVDYVNLSNAVSNAISSATGSFATKAQAIGSVDFDVSSSGMVTFEFYRVDGTFYKSCTFNVKDSAYS